MNLTVIECNIALLAFHTLIYNGANGLGLKALLLKGSVIPQPVMMVSDITPALPAPQTTYLQFDTPPTIVNDFSLLKANDITFTNTTSIDVDVTGYAIVDFSSNVWFCVAYDTPQTLTALGGQMTIAFYHTQSNPNCP